MVQEFELSTAAAITKIQCVGKHLFSVTAGAPLPAEQFSIPFWPDPTQCEGTGTTHTEPPWICGMRTVHPEGSGLCAISNLTMTRHRLLFFAMLKVVLFILAIFGLMASPVSAKIAQLDCGAMAETTAKTTATVANKMDCCDKAAKHQKSKSCVSNCAAMCGVTVSLESPATYQSPLLTTTSLVFDRAPGVAPADLARFDDPPPRLSA